MKYAAKTTNWNTTQNHGCKQYKCITHINRMAMSVPMLDSTDTIGSHLRNPRISQKTPNLQPHFRQSTTMTKQRALRSKNPYMQDSGDDELRRNEMDFGFELGSGGGGYVVFAGEMKRRCVRSFHVELIESEREHRWWSGSLELESFDLSGDLTSPVHTSHVHTLPVHAINVHM
ncbi:hypothetical protein HID58_015620 [Brassica napus]|uniref:Uncharacterized protein n=1 Tax=Brassica napus TaxID=3708 RepID=A0ABQ8DKR7_BRANA|nr:hypothetical protein HID58_015620 [Brassica napus]